MLTIKIEKEEFDNNPDEMLKQAEANAHEVIRLNHPRTYDKYFPIYQGSTDNADYIYYFFEEGIRLGH